ncbi:dienelactone hydrolase family protein [Verrucomicrobiaceae bacterium R5-34]|nr:dienelactone hydrolase family protein [Verrucomicrobiaceae bacterium R5-34]
MTKALLSLLLLVPMAGLTSAKPLPESPDKAEKPYTNLIKGKWVHQEESVIEDGLPFWFYADRKLKSARGGKKHPLVIVLHGRRNKAKPGDKFKVQSIATIWTKEKIYKEHPCFVVQPYYPPKGGWEKIPEKIDELVKHLTSHLPVDMKRIYLVGFSNGGQGTFLTLARQPDWFAGAVTMAGPVSPKQVVGKIKAPVWCWVGGNDTDLNKNVRLPALAKELQKHDDRVKLNIVPGGGHGCAPQSIGTDKVRDWLFDQRLP